MAILGSTSAIDPVYDENGREVMSRGTVAAAWQNFFICVEMFFAAIALRFAFSVNAYIDATSSERFLFIRSGILLRLQSSTGFLKQLQLTLHDSFKRLFLVISINTFLASDQQAEVFFRSKLELNSG